MANNYVDKGMDHYDQRYRDQQIQSLKKKAAKLGLQLLPATFTVVSEESGNQVRSSTQMKDLDVN